MIARKLLFTLVSPMVLRQQHARNLARTLREPRANLAPVQYISFKRLQYMKTSLHFM